MIKGRGVLALLFFIFLLLPPAPRPAEGQVVSGAILLSRALVWGSKVIRVSLPFSVTRLKSIYNSWKAQGKPAFSRLKIPFGTAVAYIGASWLLNEFQNLDSADTSSLVNDVAGVGVQGLCLAGGSCSPYTNSQNYILKIVSFTLEYNNYGSLVLSSNTVQSGAGNTGYWCSGTYSPSGPTVFRAYWDGGFREFSCGGDGCFVSSALGALPVCGSSSGSLDDSLAQLLPLLISSPVEAYPTADDPGYADAFPIPTESGDSVTIEDTSTGTTTSETTNDQGTTDQDTGQMDIPGDNVYDPTIENIPDKLPIPDLINNFISTSPLMRWVQGANISATAGSCSVSGSFLNKSFTLDFCPLAPYLNQIGAFVLAFAHLYALYIVFRVN